MRLKSDQAFILSGIEKKGKNGILADIFGDIFFGIIGSHLLLVNVLLKDIAQDIGIDLVIRTQGTFIQVPLVGIEEVKKLFKSLISNLYILVSSFQFMYIE